MGSALNKISTPTEPPPKNGQQPKPPGVGGFNAFYWRQIFALDSAVVKTQNCLILLSFMRDFCIHCMCCRFYSMYT